MHNDLEPRFDRALESIPVPDRSLAATLQRGRTIRRTRIAIGVGGLLAVVALGAVGASNLQRDELQIPPAQRQESRDGRARDVDQRALRLIDDLRPSLCRGYDFYYKAEVAGDPYRPVQCGADFRLELASGTEPAPASTTFTDEPETDLVRAPQIIIYAFVSERAKREWLGAHAPPWGGRIGGANWVIDVMDDESFHLAREAISEHKTTTIVEPTQIWQVRNHIVEPLPEDFDPMISLQLARTAADDPESEILGARLGLYSNRTGTASEPKPAWIITLRRCVPAYGGDHSSASCADDQLHIVVDAETGAQILSFSP